MAHTPVNHPLRPLYRALGFLAGAYLVVFGIIGLIQTSGKDFTGNVGVRVLGQPSNMLWSIISIIAGAIVILGAATGRNVDIVIYKYIGWGLLVLGTFSLATNRTDANFLGGGVSTTVVTYIVGLVLITAGLYSKVETPAKAGAPRQVRERRPA